MSASYGMTYDSVEEIPGNDSTVGFPQPGVYNNSCHDSLHHLGCRLVPAPPACGNFSLPTVSPYYVNYKIIVDVYFISCLCLVGFIGNALSIAVLCKDREKQNTTNSLLQTLAVVDTVYLFTCVFIQPIKTVHDMTNWAPSLRAIFPYLEPYVWVVASVAQTSAVWLVVLVTADRYVAVCRPWQTSWRSARRAKMAVTILFVVAALYNIPRLFEREVVYQRLCGTDNEWLIKTRKTKFRDDRNYFLIYKTICYFIFRAIGPLATLVVLNLRLVHALREVRKRHRDLTKRSKHRENITVMLVVVVSVFIVCQLPDLSLRIALTITEFEPTVKTDLQVLRYANAASNALLTANSSVNFLIYCLVGKKFRRILLEMTACSSRRDSSRDSTGKLAGAGPAESEAGFVGGARGEAKTMCTVGVGEVAELSDTELISNRLTPTVATKSGNGLKLATGTSAVLMFEQTHPGTSCVEEDHGC